MWFTRVSLKNPVFATMLMLALVVLGLFSYQRLKVDQFPNIDFPVVVVITEYQLYVDGRKAADDVREKVAAVRPLFRDEVKEPRVLRFDPASRPVWSVAVLPNASAQRQPS